MNGCIELAMNCWLQREYTEQGTHLTEFHNLILNNYVLKGIFISNDNNLTPDYIPIYHWSFWSGAVE